MLVLPLPFVDDIVDESPPVLKDCCCFSEDDWLASRRREDFRCLIFEDIEEPIFMVFSTTLVFPKAESPALRAKGTVRPSERPRIASEMMRGLMRDRELDEFDDTDSASDRGVLNVLYDR